MSLLAQLRPLEGWSVGSVLGGLLLLSLVVGAIVYGFVVTLRR